MRAVRAVPAAPEAKLFPAGRPPTPPAVTEGRAVLAAMAVTAVPAEPPASVARAGPADG
ncbi:Uncharacterised protein [Mycobacterium tuberculosis]|nr:Uncharacterised protein [Mycobacterium tuberculosis]CKZ85562.1 Uncharacterised protein [Mycobacterium tuberculosis]